MDQIMTAFGRLVGRLMRDLWQLLVLLAVAFYAAVTERRLSETDRGRLQYIAGCVAGTTLSCWWVWAEIHRSAAYTLAFVILSGCYVATWRSHDREVIVQKVTAAVAHKTRTDPDEKPGGLIRNTAWDGDVDHRGSRGLSEFTIRWSDKFDDSNPRAIEGLRSAVAAAIGMPAKRLELKPNTAEDYARCKVVPPDQTATSKKVPWPHIAAEQLDLWKPVPVAFDERGRPFAIDLVAHNVLVAGLMNSGKSSALQILTCAGALDPIAVMDHMDGKLIELRRWSYLSNGFVAVTPDQRVDVAGGIAMLDDLLVELGERRRFCDRKGVRKVTKSMGMPIRLLEIDELTEFINHREHGPEYTDKLMSLIRLGRAFAMPSIATITRPSSTTIDTDLRDLYDTRMSFKAMTRASLEMALGRATEEMLEELDRPGRCWVLDHNNNLRLLKTYFVDDRDIDRVCDRGLILRGRDPREVRRVVDAAYQTLLGADGQPLRAATPTSTNRSGSATVTRIGPAGGDPDGAGRARRDSRGDQ
jgi:FtsK/SpoIIIE family